MKRRSNLVTTLVFLCSVNIGVSESYALTKDFPEGLVRETIVVPFDRGSIEIPALLESDLRILACMTSDEVGGGYRPVRIFERWPDGGPVERELTPQRMNKVVSIFTEMGIAPRAIRERNIYIHRMDRDLAIRDKCVIVVEVSVRKLGQEEKRRNCRSKKTLN